MKTFPVRWLWLIVTAVGIVDAATVAHAESVVPRIELRLRSDEPITIVCLGDSVTGIYYHTGGRRAYPEMLAIAIAKAFPQAKLRVVNAGVSGNTTADGLARLDRDVLQHVPQLVTIMFGLNDMGALSREQFCGNLRQIIDKCRSADAEVLLCTPNGVEETEARPTAKLLSYIAGIREVANERKVTLVDVYAAFDSLQHHNPADFSLLMSDPIHPNLDGHKLTAALLATAIVGRELSVAEEPAENVALDHTRRLLAESKPVKVLAMAPFDVLLPAAIRRIYPTTDLQVDAWNVAGKSLNEIEVDAERVRQSRPDLVVVAIPFMARVDSDLKFTRNFGNVLNRTLSFGRREWDVLVVAPSTVHSVQNPEQRHQDDLIRRLIRAQDLLPVDPHLSVGTNSIDSVTQWLRPQLLPL